MRSLFLLLPLLIAVHSKDYTRLFEELLGGYNRLIRPAKNVNDTVKIEFKLKLGAIVDVHEKDQVITTNGWLLHSWRDYRLSWRPARYGGIQSIHVPGEMLWLPDIILYNNAHGSPSVSFVTKVDVHYDGTVNWNPPVVYKSVCRIDVEWFPYDTQMCELKFGSWTYSGWELDMAPPFTDVAERVSIGNDSEWRVEEGVDTSEYTESVEWDLLSAVGTRHEKWYSCCDYPSIDLTYSLLIRRKKLFYTAHLVFPCAGIAALTSWVFYLPCDSHQKIQLCVSVLVTLTVYFLLLIELIPPTSLVLPLIGKYLVFTMCMVTMSIVSTVVVENMHFRVANYPMPDWMRTLFIEHIGRYLRIFRPEHITKKKRADIYKKMNAISAMSILEQQFHKTLFDLEMMTVSKQERQQPKPPGVGAIFLELPLMKRSKSVKPNAKPPTPVRKTSNSPLRRQFSIMGKGAPEIKAYKSSFIRNKLKKAERNVNYIAQTLTDQRKAEELQEDWQYISMVIDRMLLIIFTTTITIGTLISFIKAPSLSDDRIPIT